MNYQIELHPRARWELMKIRDSIVDVGGTVASRRIIRAIESAISGLGRVLHNGTLRHEVGPGVRSIPAAKNGVVTFRVDDDTRTVMIIAVTYAGHDWMGRGKGRL